MDRDLLRRLDANLEGYIAFVLLIVYTVIITQDIFRRWLFGTQSDWGLQVVLGLFTWMAWLAASMAIRKESHFRFTLTREKVSNRVNYYLHYFDVVLWVSVVLVVLWYSLPSLVSRVETTRNITGTPIPQYLMFLAVPVGFTFMLFRAIQRIFVIRNRYRNGEDVTPDSAIE